MTLVTPVLTFFARICNRLIRAHRLEPWYLIPYSARVVSVFLAPKYCDYYCLPLTKFVLPTYMKKCLSTSVPQWTPVPGPQVLFIGSRIEATVAKGKLTVAVLKHLFHRFSISGWVLLQKCIGSQKVCLQCSCSAPECTLKWGDNFLFSMMALRK